MKQFFKLIGGALLLWGLVYGVMILIYTIGGGK